MTTLALIDAIVEVVPSLNLTLPPTKRLALVEIVALLPFTIFGVTGTTRSDGRGGPSEITFVFGSC